MHAPKLEWCGRWTLILPVVMLAITTVLVFLTAIQDQQFWATHPHFSDTPWEIQPPARLFAELINGPGFYLTFLCPGIRVFGLNLRDFGRLAGVVVFWTWIGWGLDRRVLGLSTSIIRRRWLRASVYAVLLGLTILFIWGTLEILDSHQMLPSKDLWHHRRSLFALGLRASALAEYAAIPWALVFLIYFGKQLLVAFKAHPPEETTATPVK
jgi:uncharacterized membrane protein YqhA